MLGRDDIRLDDETGTTLVELLVGMAMGMIVLAGLTMLLIVVLHRNARVDARVEATDNGRIAVTRIMEELHSACTVHDIVPVRKESTINTLEFVHAANTGANEVEPEAVRTEIKYKPATPTSPSTLTQTDYEEISGGTELDPLFKENGSSRLLLTNVVPAGKSGGVFSYYRFGATEPLAVTPNATLGANASKVIVVNVALMASPRSSLVADAGAATTVEDSATLRLTPPSSIGTEAQPCD